MSDFDLYREYKDYNPESDLNGNWGHLLADRILQRCGGVENLQKWLMQEELKYLEKEAILDVLEYQNN